MAFTRDEKDEIRKRMMRGGGGGDGDGKDGGLRGRLEDRYIDREGE